MVNGSVDAILEQRDLEMHFMPIVRFWTDRGASRWSRFALEALIRGPRESPLRQPDDLFAAAQAAGLRDRLELLCLETALEKFGELPPNVLLFLNVGVSTFLGPGFEALLEGWQDRVDPSRIVFEIVEGTVPNAHQFRRHLERGMAQGFQFALDDLPTDGEALRRLVEAGPVAFLKLDRSFIRRWQEDRRATGNWLRFMIEISSAVNAQLVLEGVESPLLDSLPELSSLGLKLAQGYLFGEPAILAPGFQRWRKGSWPGHAAIADHDLGLAVVSRAAAARLNPVLLRPPQATVH